MSPQNEFSSITSNTALTDFDKFDSVNALFDKVSKNRDPDDYCDCRDLAFCIREKTNRSAEGFELVDEWLMQSEKYTEKFAYAIYYEKRDSKTNDIQKILNLELIDRLQSSKISISKSEYLTQDKGFNPKDIERLLDDSARVESDGNTLFGEYSAENGDLIGISIVKNSNEKWQHKGGRKGVHFVNQSAGDNSFVIIGEGTATVMSAVLASDCKYLGISASGASGLSQAVKAARNAKPGALIVIVADAGKTGTEAAYKAAKADSHSIIRIAKSLSATTPDNFDCNDLMIESGLDAVTKQLKLPKPKQSRELLLTRYDQLPPLEPPDWLIKDVLLRGSLCAQIAPPAHFKSFLALEMALSLCTKTPFHGHAVPKKCSVAFVAGEGIRGLGYRIEAWLKYHKIEERDFDLFLSNKGASLFEQPEIIIQQLDSLAQVDFIVFDTLPRNAPGLDENSAKEMSELVCTLDSINDRFDCSCIVLQHTPHTNPKRARGSTSLFGALDTEYLLERSISVIHGLSDLNFTCTKMKDFEPIHPMSLRPVVIELDHHDEDGRPITSLVFERKDDFAPLIPAVRGKNQQALYNAIQAEPDQGNGWRNLDNACVRSGLAPKRKSESINGLVRNQKINVEGEMCKLL